ncbi:cupin domain-containing protein [Rhizobium sp. SL86]|uniref:cupin domain-containing protein n=1 Tax=Rhizobium sp. SL86 TaxID=2995148 RepID=UPI002273E7BF|nr:cupin domain-containing protein [Rhizobium sp. SL86]MCY1664379.1 cupin domain-containing protein [Rhizobium sp. SL86]
MTVSCLQGHMFSSAESRDWFQPLPGEQIAMRVESHHTGGAFSLTEIIVAPQSGPPLHIHTDADEVLYVLEGTVDFICGSEQFRTGAGGFAAIPRGTPHAFRNFEAQPARMLVMLTPGGFEQFMPAMRGRPMSDVPDLARSFGMEIVGPPIAAPAQAA